MAERSSRHRPWVFGTVLINVLILATSCSFFSDNEDVALPTPTTRSTTSQTLAGPTGDRDPVAASEGRGRYGDDAAALEDVAAVDWVVESLSVGDRRQPAPAVVTLLFSIRPDGAVSAGGNAGCNRYFAEVVVEPARLSISPVGLTKRLCPGQRDWLDYVNALPQVTAWSVDEDVLTLTGDEVTVVAVRR